MAWSDAMELIAKIKDCTFTATVSWMCIQSNGAILLMIDGKRGLYEYTGPNPFDDEESRSVFLDHVRKVTLDKEGDL
jgi:hypothetical protein